MSLYTGVIVLDWISGYRASKKDGSYASEYGIDGGFRTIFLFIVPALAHGVDLLMSTPNVVFGFALLSFGFHVWK
ncbi:phage holin family protein [Sporosarcina sp. NPDC096371]|uniref:phage holin family protein n=1 Tax=Sporosarcina sp. NPDC096371 TaxID=3364530 RepID=UPI003801C66D